LNKLIFSILLISIFSSALVSAAITSINYPVANDIISETARVKLDVSSSGSSNCYFNYNNVKNVSVSCNGVSLVDLPNGNGDYNITVGDNSSSSITQVVSVRRMTGSVVVFIYLLSILTLMGIVFDIFYLFGKAVDMSVTLYDLGISYSLAFGLMIDYQLAVEYIRIPFLIDWLNICVTTSLWMLMVGGTSLFAFSFIYNYMKKNKPQPWRGIK
jgi:hypothetical protein